MERQLSGTQRLITRLVGPETAAAMEAHSRAWLVRCSKCGHERSIWELGGIRYRAVGEPRTLLRCPACGERGWHQIAKAADFPTGPAPGWPIVRLVLATLLGLLIIGAVIFGIVLTLVDWL